jgi:glyoxylase-like metal-dependent hydrolase (beta-lactamase superfamily II)
VGEPRAVAAAAEQVVPGLAFWQLHDDRIDFVSSSHAVQTEDGVILVDPLPLAPEELVGLGPVSAIVLTCGNHQRSSWRLRRELGAPVYAPALSKLIDEEPDVRYEEGDSLPAGLRAIFTPGAGVTQHALLVEPAGALITSDLFAHSPGSPLTLVPAQYMHDPEQARRSAERLLDLDFDVLCTGHGRPLLGGAQDAIRAALAA